MDEILGVDVADVIIDRRIGRANSNEELFFLSDRFRETPAVTGVFDGLRRLREERFGDRIHLICKAGKPDEGKFAPNRIERRNRAWFQHHDFFTRTGIDPSHVHFCLTRSMKAEICRSLGVTHMVDDRLEVFAHMAFMPHKYLFRPREDEIRARAQLLDQVIQVETWEELLCELL